MGPCSLLKPLYNIDYRKPSDYAKLGLLIMLRKRSFYHDTVSAVAPKGEVSDKMVEVRRLWARIGQN